MRARVSVLALVLLSTAALAAADGPRLLFDRSQIGALRQRIARPTLAPVWAKILDDAEAYCDRASPRYADPQDPCPLSQKPGRMEQKRHDALLVHTIGRLLTQRMETIGFAYQLTGRKSLGQHGAALLAATVERFPIANPIVAKGFAGGRGDIMRGLAIGYDLFGGVPRRSAAKSRRRRLRGLRRPGRQGIQRSEAVVVQGPQLQRRQRRRGRVPGHRFERRFSGSRRRPGLPSA